MRRRVTEAGVLMAAWSPILLFWLVLIRVYGHMTFAESLPRAVVTVGSAALLGIAVRRFCARVPCPGELRAGFYLLHFVVATLSPVAWIIFPDGLESPLPHRPIRAPFT